MVVQLGFLEVKPESALKVLSAGFDADLGFFSLLWSCCTSIHLFSHFLLCQTSLSLINQTHEADRVTASSSWSLRLALCDSKRRWDLKV